MKKRLNIEGITNELKGGSAFFPDFEKEEANQQADNHTAPPATRHPEPLPQASANANSDKESASKAPLNKLPHYNAQFQYQEPVQPKRQIPSVQDKSYKPERANVPTPARPNGKRI